MAAAQYTAFRKKTPLAFSSLSRWKMFGFC